MKDIENDFLDIAGQCDRIGDFYNAASSRYELGMLYNLQGRWPDAGRSLISSFESLNDRYGGAPDPSRPWAMHVDKKFSKMDRKSKLLLSACRFQIGITYLGETHYDLALEEFKKSLDFDKAVGDLQGQKLCEIGIAKCHAALKRKATKNDAG